MKYEENLYDFIKKEMKEGNIEDYTEFYLTFEGKMTIDFDNINSETIIFNKEDAKYIVEKIGPVDESIYFKWNLLSDKYKNKYLNGKFRIKDVVKEFEPSFYTINKIEKKLEEIILSNGFLAYYYINHYGNEPFKNELEEYKQAKAVAELGKDDNDDKIVEMLAKFIYEFTIESPDELECYLNDRMMSSSSPFEAVKADINLFSKLYVLANGYGLTDEEKEKIEYVMYSSLEALDGDLNPFEGIQRK